MLYKVFIDAKLASFLEKGLKLLTSKQLHQRLPTETTKVNAGNTSKKLLN